MRTVADFLQGKYRLIEIGHERTVLAAAKKMDAERIGALLVTRGGKVVGIITERDMLSRVVAALRDPAETAVEAVMSSPVLSVDLATPLDECRELMHREKVRHLLVRDGERAVAVVSARDLLHAQTAVQADHIEKLEEYLYQYA